MAYTYIAVRQWVTPPLVENFIDPLGLLKGAYAVYVLLLCFGAGNCKREPVSSTTGRGITAREAVKYWRMQFCLRGSLIARDIPEVFI